MTRSTVRLFAVFVLALLGAPVGMHVVLHDLHHDHAQEAEVYATGASHGDHEHPMVSSSAPVVPAVARASLPIVAAPAAVSATWTRITTAERNTITFGALRTDTDVGLQPLLATFLI